MRREKAGAERRLPLSDAAGRGVWARDDGPPLVFAEGLGFLAGGGGDDTLAAAVVGQAFLGVAGVPAPVRSMAERAEAAERLRSDLWWRPATKRQQTRSQRPTASRFSSASFKRLWLTIDA